MIDFRHLSDLLPWDHLFTTKIHPKKLEIWKHCHFMITNLNTLWLFTIVSNKTLELARTAHRDDYNMAECFELALSRSGEGHMHQSILYQWPIADMFTLFQPIEFHVFGIWLRLQWQTKLTWRVYLQKHQNIAEIFSFFMLPLQNCVKSMWSPFMVNRVIC